jgi:O-antigen/teichoic acid export membrane protein
MVVSLALNVALNLLLLPSLGVMGASIASSISYTCWFLFVGGYLASQAYRRPPGAPPREQIIG